MKILVSLAFSIILVGILLVWDMTRGMPEALLKALILCIAALYASLVIGFFLIH